MARYVLFQSRNRGSFDFKVTEKKETQMPTGTRFNLVIEVLLISSSSVLNLSLCQTSAFQSRNRGSFDFK